VYKEPRKQAGIFFGIRFQNVILDYEYQPLKIRTSGVRGCKPPDRGKNSWGRVEDERAKNKIWIGEHEWRRIGGNLYF
jgi:hypothetical protein